MIPLALASFRKKDWPRWRELDPNFEPSFSRWKRKAAEAAEQLERKGIVLVHVVIDPDAFVAWCRRNDRDVGDLGARAAYAAIQMGKGGIL